MSITEPASDRSRSQAVFTNLLLHVMPTRIHRYSLKLKATLGLGVISLVLFVLLTVTGVALMIYYKPATDQAYDSMKDIRYIVPTGRFMRNIHRWGAHAMVACVILHMARVFYTSAYKGARKFNWVVGMLLFVVSAMSRTSVIDITRQMWPFYLVHVAVIFLITYFPEVALWLPRVLGF